jgi:hypothetical protein
VRDLLDILKPKPSPHRLIRIGGNGDGAYLLPDDLEGIQSCFSPGVFRYKRFEDELVNKHQIRCHLCDYSVSEDTLETGLIPGWQTFEKLWLDVDGSSSSITLEQWVQRHCPDPTADLLLQMDIEKAEYRNLNSTPRSILERFRIILIELHGLDALADRQQAAQEIGPLLHRLDQTHICVHAHPNNCQGDYLDPETGMNVPSVLELTFLRRDRFADVQPDRLLMPMLPHPLDLATNVGPQRPSLHLNEAWLPGGRRRIRSKLKMTYDLHLHPLLLAVQHAVAKRLKTSGTGSRLLAFLKSTPS